MTVKLSLLDKKDVIHYSKTVPVCIFDGTYKTIGICTVFRDEQGRHFGELHLDQEVSFEYYFYYRNQVNAAGIFWFAGLDLMKDMVEQNPTTQLKEMVVD